MTNGEWEAGLRAVLDDRLRTGEPMAMHTTFHIGGPAELFVTGENLDSLRQIVTSAQRLGVPYFLLGGGSNILVSDRGIRGLVIENRAQGARFEKRGTEATLHAASGVPISRLARQAARQGLSGLEWAAGIPGTVGGAVVGNAGAYGVFVADNLQRVTVLDTHGQQRAYRAEELEFGYRTSRFKRQETGGRGQEIILSAEFWLVRASRVELQSLVEERIARRKATQPAEPSAGSVFKNPPGDYAGRLIEAAGLKGHRIGRAEVAGKHANFIVNRGGAQAGEVKALIDRVRETVHERFGVELDLEILLVGEWE